MADETQLQELKKGAKTWNVYRIAHNHTAPQLSGADLSGVDLADADLSQADLSGANLSRATLGRTNLRGASLRNANMTGTDLSGAELSDADFTRAVLEHANLRGSSLWQGRFVEANLRQTKWTEAQCTNADFSAARMESAILAEGQFASCTFYKTELSRANLNRARFSRCNLTEARLSAATFEKTFLDHCTIDRLVFADHASMLDFSDTIRLPTRDRVLRRSRVHAIGQLPVFAVSWSSLIAVVTIINAIAWLNENACAIGFSGSISIPTRLALLLLSLVLLTIGSTVYKCRCPQIVQAFNETRWVAELRYARPLYLAEDLRRRGAQVVAASFLVVGGAASLLILIERLWPAVREGGVVLAKGMGL